MSSSKLAAAAGLAHLSGGKYRAAALKFTAVSPELGASWSDVLSLRDAGTYGALCALASLERGELRREVLDSVGFREVLEAVPEVRWRGRG